jgi:stage II sporulation protein GA (sporulation sigma-E factor processing peptidase)
LSDPKVYLDLTFLNNFIMDFIILWATSRLSGLKPNHTRLAIAAAMGAAYAVGYVWLTKSLLFSLTGKIVFSLLMVIIAINPVRWQDYGKVLLYFYVINFTVAGATIAASSLLEGSVVENISPAIWIVVAIVAALAIGLFAGRYVKDHLLPELLKFQVVLRFGNQHCAGHGFVDTGNALKDPLTRRPVIVAEYALIKSCLPQDLQHMMEGNQNEEALLEQIMSSSWANRLRLIPFSSIGRKNGMLLGIRADEVVLNIGSKDIMHKNAVVGIYREQLNPQGNYQLLIPADMVEG